MQSKVTDFICSFFTGLNGTSTERSHVISSVHPHINITGSTHRSLTTETSYKTSEWTSQGYMSTTESPYANDDVNNLMNGSL